MPQLIDFKGREPIGSSTYPMPNDKLDYQLHLSALDICPNPANNLSTLYIHIPFCDQICSFCGFNKFVSTEEKKNIYIKALLQEMKCYAEKEYIKGLDIQAVYLGGGTPNSLSAKQLEQIMQFVINHFNLSSDCEITCEGTPQNFTDERISVLKNNRTTRVSAGIQTMNLSIREKFLNMKYSESEIADFISNIQNNFDNFNLDFIYNLPGQTFDIWDNDLNVALTSSATHLTMYPLVLLEKTAFYSDYVKLSKRNIPSEEQEIAFFETTLKRLNQSAFKSYTIRDWSKSNRHCRYIYLNALCNHVLAFGAGAHGFIADLTYRNHKNLNHYIQLLLDGKTLPLEAHKVCKEENIMQRFMVMGLRLVDLDMTYFDSKFNQSWKDIYGMKIENLVYSGYLRLDGNQISFTPKGHIWANNIRTYFEEEKGSSVGYTDSIGISKTGKDHYHEISRIKASADVEAHS